MNRINIIYSLLKKVFVDLIMRGALQSSFIQKKVLKNYMDKNFNYPGLPHYVRNDVDGILFCKRYLFIGLSIFLIPTTSLTFFDNHNAASAYKKGDFKAAQDIYKKQLIDEPDNGQLLFNLGDSAYRLQEYQQARAYFSQAAELLTKNRELQEQAYYNAGNAYFKEKKLQESLELYHKVLELNPENEKALHNKKVVEELLKQKEQMI